MPRFPLLAALLAALSSAFAALPLHPRAEILREADGARQGRLPLSLPAAHAAWSSRLLAAGWTLQDDIPLPGKPGPRLSLWRRGAEQHSLLLIPHRPGLTHFLLTPDPTPPAPPRPGVSRAGSGASDTRSGH